jgi:enoyl-[acyl-carrier protein] reductase I
MPLLEHKTALVFGIANDRSIAWAISRLMHAHGASIALSYASEALQRRVEPLAAQISAAFVRRCDVTRDEEIDALFRALGNDIGRIDILVHALAYAERDDLRGDFSQTSRAGFHTAMDISVYSLVALARAALPMMSADGSIVTLSYYGGQKVAPNYNVMGVAKAALESATRYLAAELGPRGIRVNAISAGPVRTLSAQGVAGFRRAASGYAASSPMRRGITAEDVGNAAVWLCSDMARNVTGEVLFVDGGYNIMAGGSELQAE